jgi:hypothetical protein
VPALVLVGFFIASQGIGGPAYMSDEVGYLDKAATLAGSAVHLSTSWFAGYSILISPAFLVSSNPHVEWAIILALNALMWAGSAALLQYVLRRTHPRASRRAVTLASFGAMLYPSWVSMSGYAFATSGFVLVFMACLATLIKSRLTSRRWLAIAALLAGYLCWVHPLGFLLVAAVVVLLALQGWLQRRWSLGLLAIVGALIGLCYPVLVRSWFSSRMSGSVTNDSHYTDGASSGLLHAAGSLHYWLQVGELLVGLAFFAVVATFGLIVYASLPTLQRVWQARRVWHRLASSPRAVALVLPIPLVIGVIVVTAVTSATSSQLRMDQWVYGRYTDMYLLPLIGYGLLKQWRPMQAWRMGAFILLSGCLLSIVANSQNTLFSFDNKVNIQGLWPMQLASLVHANWYWVWGVLGAAGVIVCGYLGTARLKRFLPILALPVLLTCTGNYVYHLTIVRQHASVSSLYDYIKAQYAKTDCIGFTPDPDSNERFNLYSYYLHGYNIQKMTVQQWQQQGCEGPYLTYDATLSARPGLQLAAVESTTQLLMVTHGTGMISAASTERLADGSPLPLQRSALIFK